MKFPDLRWIGIGIAILVAVVMAVGFNLMMDWQRLVTPGSGSQSLPAESRSDGES